MACRIEMRDLSINANWQDRDMAFKKMFAIFKKQVAEAGILHQLKRHEHYESPGVKKRRKSKEAENQRLKQQLRESFPERRSNKTKEEK